MDEDKEIKPTVEGIEEYFRSLRLDIALRTDTEHHLGLGDIRITMEQQKKN